MNPARASRRSGQSKSRGLEVWNDVGQTPAFFTCVRLAFDNLYTLARPVWGMHA